MENNICRLNPKDFKAVVDGKKTDLFILRDRKSTRLNSSHTS